MTPQESPFEQRFPAGSIDLPLNGRRRSELLEEVWNAAEADLITRLRENGVEICSFQDLQDNEALLAAAVPTLLGSLRRIRYAGLLFTVIRLMATVKEERRRVLPVMLDLFRNPPYVMDPFNDVATRKDWDHGVRESVANVIGPLADRFLWPQYLDLVRDVRYGGSRSVLIDYIHRIEDPRVPEILVDLLDDRTVVTFALHALGRIRYSPARVQIERLADDPNDEVRRQVRYALKRLAPDNPA